MNTKPIIQLAISILALSILASCAPDPRKEAIAFEIKSAAEQEAANDELLRQQSENRHEIELKQLELDQAHREATAAKWDAAINAIFATVKIFGSVAVAISLTALAVSFSRASYGVASAIATAADIRANLIHLDKATGQFPLLRHVHGPRWAIHNANDGSLLMLDERHEPDRQLISAMGATQLAGVIGQYASKSTDPAGLAMMKPTIIHAEDETITIGDTFKMISERENA